MTSDERLRSDVRSLPAARAPAGVQARSLARLVERRANAAPARRHRALGVALVVAVVVVVAVLVRGRATSTAPVAPRLPDEGVTVVRAGTSARPERMRNGATVDAGTSDALLGDGATWVGWLRRGSVARVEQNGRRVLLTLEHGEVGISSAPRRADEAMQIVTSGARIRVIGTVLTVRSGPGGHAVWVAHGSVEVQPAAGSARRVSAGSSWASGDGAPLVLPAATTDWLDALSREGPAALRRPWEGPPVPIAAPPSTAAARSVQPLDRELEPEPIAAAPADARGHRRPATTDVEAPAPRVEPEAPGVAVPSPEEDSDALFRRARDLERRADYVHAVELYVRVAAGRGTSAELALYRAGRLRARFLGDPSGALATLRECARRFPAGAVRQEVDLSILEVLSRTGFRIEAAREADEFLRRWPTSERRVEVEAIRDQSRGGGRR